MTFCCGVWMNCWGKSPSMIVRGIPAGRHLPVGSSMPRLLKAAKTFCAAHGWYGAGSRPAGRSFDDSVTGADGLRPLPPTPTPPFVSSHDPRCVLPPCHTPVKSGLPSDARGTALFTGAVAVCADRETVSTARMTATMKPCITAPPLPECFRRHLYPPEDRRTVSCHPGE